MFQITLISFAEYLLLLADKIKDDGVNNIKYNYIKK